MNLFEKGYPIKIHIIGAVGSGKTTLARILSYKLKIPFYELDNVVWKRLRSKDVRRSDEERNNCLMRILNSDSWIVEGVHYEWVYQSFKESDVIILLDSDYRTRLWRIIKRFIRQKMRVEKANYKPTIQMFRMMLHWNASFEYEHKPRILEILQQYEDKLIVLMDNSQLESFFENEEIQMIGN